MPSLLDIGLLDQSSLIFAFIFVWVIVYGVLVYTKWLGDDKHNIYAVMALAVALLTIFTPSILGVITNIVPWFVLLLIVLVFLIILLMSLGFTKDHITTTLRSKEWSATVVLWVIILVAIIVLSGVGKAFFDPQGPGQEETETTIDPDTGLTTRGDVESEGSGALFATLFHPKVLGLILVMLIGVFLLQQLGKGSLS
jgi:hypothetical protein